MKKAKYQLDKDLKFLENQALFPCIYVYPLVNLFIGMITCKSDENVSVRKVKTPGYNGQKLTTLIIEPRDSAGFDDKLPCIVFYHGGGILLKAVQSHYQFAKWYAAKAKCKVVMPDYRLMPKYRFPVATMDCYKTYEWVLDNADMLGIDKDKIIMTGDSAGATLVGEVFFMLKDNKLTLPIGTLMVYPALDRRVNTQSMRKFVDTPVLNSRTSKMFWDEYLKGAVPEKKEYVSPLEAQSFDQFPRTYIEVAEFDSLHDDGVLLADRLREEKIPVEFHEVKGSCHGYEVALGSRIVKDALDRRISWIQAVYASVSSS